MTQATGTDGNTGTSAATVDTGRQDGDGTSGDGTDDDESDAVLGPKGISALRKLRAENRTLQRQLAEKSRTSTAQQRPPVTQTPPATGTGESGNSATVDEAAIRATIEREYAVKFGGERAKDRAIALLASSGYKGKAERGVKLLDLDGAVKDDGSIDDQALRDAVDELKEDEPDRFGDEDEQETTPRVRRQVGSADGGRKTPVTTPKTAAESLAARRFGTKSSRR